MRYLVTKEIKSDTQVVWKLYFQDFAFLVIWVVINWNIQGIVNSHLQVPFFIFAVIIGVILVLPSGLNSKRRQYQSIALYLMRSKDVFYLIRKESDDEKKQDQRSERHYSGRKL